MAIYTRKGLTGSESDISHEVAPGLYAIEEKDDKVILHLSSKGRFEVSYPQRENIALKPLEVSGYIKTGYSTRVSECYEVTKPTGGVEEVRKIIAPYHGVEWAKDADNVTIEHRPKQIAASR